MIFPRTFDWNSAVRSWNPDPKLTKERAALVLFDVLEEYVHPKDPAKAAVMKERRVAERLTQLLNGAREAGLTVFYAAANHSPDGSDVVARLTDTDMDLRPWPDGAQPFRPTVHRGEAGAQIARELAPRPNEIVIYKHRWSAFYQTSLELNLGARRRLRDRLRPRRLLGTSRTEPRFPDGPHLSANGAGHDGGAGDRPDEVRRTRKPAMKGYRLSKALQDHNSPPKMKEFLAQIDTMRVRYELTDEEVDAIRRADLERLYALGANPYLIRFAFRDRYRD